MTNYLAAILACLDYFAFGTLASSQELFLRLDHGHIARKTVIVSLSDKLPQYRTVFTAMEDTITWDIVYNLTFAPTQGKKPTLTLDDTIKGGVIAVSCVFVDLDFDGFKDIRLQTELGARRERTFHNWIFDPVYSIFRLNHSYDDIPDEIKLDEQHKTISFSGHTFSGSQNDFSDAIYKVVNGNASLFEVVYTQEVNDHGKLRVKKRIERRIGNAMKVVKQSNTLTNRSWQAR